MGSFSVGKFSLGHQSLEKAEATSKSSSPPTSRSSSFDSLTSSASSLSLTSMKNAGKAKFKQMFRSSTASSSSPLSEEALNKMQMVKNEQGHYKNIVKGLKSDTHKMIPSVVTQDRVDDILAILAQGGEKGLSALKVEATGNGKLRSITTNLQNLTAMEDYAQKSGQPLSPKRQAFIEEAKSLLSAPVSNGSKDIPFSEWATRGNYEDGVLQTGWSPVAQAHMRDHLEKVQDFAARYQAAYESPFSMSRLQARSGASLKKMQQSMRQFSTPSSNSSGTEFGAPMRRESAPARMESTPLQREDSLPFANISTFSPPSEKFEGYGDVSTFSPFSPRPASNSGGSAPARMEPAQHAPEQYSAYGQGRSDIPSSSYYDPAAIKRWAQGVHTSTQQPQPATQQRPQATPAASPVTNSSSFNAQPTGQYLYFNAKARQVLNAAQTDPESQIDSYLRLETEFEAHENTLHAHEKEAIRDTFREIESRIFRN